jgi:hypothetical protein
MPYYIYNTLSSVFDEFGFKIIKKIFAILNHFNEIAMVHNYQYFLTNSLKIKTHIDIQFLFLFSGKILNKTTGTIKYMTKPQKRQVHFL